MPKGKLKLAFSTAKEHPKGQHERCAKCDKQMCYYYHSVGEWVCFTPGLCDECYFNSLKK